MVADKKTEPDPGQIVLVALGPVGGGSAFFRRYLLPATGFQLTPLIYGVHLLVIGP